MAKFDAMFSDSNNGSIKKPESHPQRVTKWLHYTKLIDNAAQYCNEKDKEEIIALAELIDADKCVLQNLLVRKTDTDEYEIIAGHKRRRACRYLVEEKGKKEYEFVPCTIESISDVKAEFQLYSSNSHHEKTDYEKMHELERMKYLLENYPEEFPHLQTGRMVERLAKQMKLKKTTVGEYLTMSKNLGENARDAFKQGTINKTAAVELASLSEMEQDTLLNEGMTSQKTIQAYKVEKEPSEEEVNLFYQNYAVKYDSNRRQLREQLLKHFGRCHSGGSGGIVDFVCNPRGICLNDAKEITWSRFVQLVNEYFPVEKIAIISEEGTEKEQIKGQLHVANTEMEIEEDEPASGDTEAEVVQTEQEEKVEYTSLYFLREQKDKLNIMLQAERRGEKVPDIALNRQKILVSSLELLTSNIKALEETEGEEQPELPQLINAEQRKAWLDNYKDWGVWYRDEHIGAIYYKYDFHDGTRLIAETYPEQYSSYAFMHLVGGPQKRPVGSDGIGKYPHHAFYSRHSDSETVLLEFLKEIQKR